ncbi:MAG: hypothetical protein R3F05_01860 [Planctomycetota bacterium]
MSGEPSLLAIHEAAHAVAMVHLGLPVAQVSVLGSTAWQDGVARHTRAFVSGAMATAPQSVALVSLAGCAAQVVAGSKQYELVCGGREDYQSEAERVARWTKANHRADFALYSQARGVDEVLPEDAAVALEFVKANRDPIRAVAETLMERGQLSGAEVTAVLAPKQD